MHDASILVKLGEHKNLVKVLGYCIEETKVFFIYKFVRHSSLDHLLFDPTCNLLDWTKRHKIILSVARVLLYIHKHAPIRIIHSDVTARNVRLDENFDPKLANFGFAVEINDTDNIHINAVRGALGYIAPEYLMKSHLSTKVDVFGFGVLVLETITGRRAFELNLRADMHLVDYVHRYWLEGTYTNIIDPRMDVNSSLMAKFIEIGLLCVQKEATDRPTMKEVVGMLLGNSSITLPVLQMRSRMIEELSKCSISPVDDYDTTAVEDFISDLSTR